MSDYDYGNARLRVMKSRLLSTHELDALAESGSIQGLIAALLKTGYRKSLEAALARATALESINDALHIDLVNTVNKVRHFFSNQAGEMVSLWFQYYDVQNLKTILRGLARNASPAEILLATIPVGLHASHGELSQEVMRELVRAPGLRGLIDLLVSNNLPFGQPLLKLRSVHPGAELFEMELALDRWYYQESIKQLQNDPQEADSLLFALKVDADFKNLLTILRFVHEPTERNMLREHWHFNELKQLFIGPGFLSFDLLSRSGSQDNLESMVAILSKTLYVGSLQAGLASFAKSGRLSDFEQQLRRFYLRWMSSLITNDPLGIGVLLGFFALKINEISNMRRIAYGINSGMKIEIIRSELEYAA